MSEKVLDEENWKVEAEAVIKDLKAHVKEANVSKKVPNSNQLIYVNITTLENRNYCVELSSSGFRVVGSDYDLVDTDSMDYFETPYSLMNEISVEFRKSFGNALLDKLKALEQL